MFKGNMQFILSMLPISKIVQIVFREPLWVLFFILFVGGEYLGTKNNNEREIVVEAGVYTAETDTTQIMQSFAYNKGNTPAEVTNINEIRTALRNPQEFTNVKKLYSYCDYYVNYDSICSGAIKNIFIPFSQAPYRLTGGTQKARTFFEQLFIRNNLEDVVRGCANDYFKYANTFLFLNDDYTLQLLPPHRCYIENLAVDGEPVISYEIDRTNEMGKTDTEKLERKYHGYPKEILDGVKKGESYAQLPIGKCFSIAYSKASWEKYALPPIASALPWLVEKESLNKTLLSELGNMRSTILHVKVGDKDKNAIPSEAEIRKIGQSFVRTLKSDQNQVVATSWNVDAEFKNGGTKDALSTITSLMANINWNILSSLTISSVLAAGDNLPEISSNSNFSTIQAAVTLINKRINAFLNDLAKALNKIINAISIEEGIKKPPQITFELVDLTENEGITTLLLDLYDKGFLSYQTVFEHTKFDYDEEFEKKQREINDGINTIFVPPAQPYNKTGGEEGGRPTLDMDERTTDVDGKNENPSPSDSK